MAQTDGLRRGNPGNKGGTGRPPDKFRELCRKEIDKHKLVKRIGEMAAGKPIDQPILATGKIVPLPCNPSTQLSAFAELADRGYGKPKQETDITIEGLNEMLDADHEKYK